MKSQEFILALFALSELGAASPVFGDTSFTIHRQDTGGRIPRDGPRALEAAYLKYGIPVPTELSEAVAKSQSGSVTATPQIFDKDYLCPVHIGTPAQEFMLDFDTGSSDLWVFSSAAPKNVSKGHNIYKPKSSSTSKFLKGEHWQVLYGDFSFALGNIYNDTVTIGGVTSPNQAVQCATDTATSFINDKARDGILGLAFKKINSAMPSKVEPFFMNVLKNLARPLFAANLKHDEPGSYDFGFIDTKKYKGELIFVPSMRSTGFWEIELVLPNKNITALVDSGTAGILLPTDFVAAYYAQVKGAIDNSTLGGWNFPCNAALPDLAIPIGGRNFIVPGNFINYAPLRAVEPSSNSTACYGALQSGGIFPFGVLGDPFLEHHYVVFDAAKKSIGFAQQA